ncbi:hypothetical protein Hanom_Chr05g00396171 [Helianthus anomalus]
MAIDICKTKKLIPLYLIVTTQFPDYLTPMPVMHTLLKTIYNLVSNQHNYFSYTKLQNFIINLSQSKLPQTN